MDKSATINDYVNDRKNNYDFIRFLAATLVIFSHAYPLTSHEGEFLLKLSNIQWSMGSMAVAIFFIISGFLVTQSFDRSSNLVKFIKARILRIFPGLIVAVLFGAFVIGPIVTTLPLKEYMTNSGTYNYLKTIFLFPMHWLLPGVFEHSSFDKSINGSLWTIPFEILSYVVVAILGVIGLLKNKKVVLLLFVLFMYIKKYLIMYVPDDFGLVYLPSFFDLFPFFSAGMVMYLYRDKIVLNKWYAMISLLILIISLKFGGFIDAFTIFGTYLIFYIAYNKKIKLNNFAKHGDLSFGIYIYAFPIQQTVTYLFGGKVSVLLNIVISLPIILVLAYLSWNLVEKQALKLKNKKINKLNQKDQYNAA